MNPKGVTYPMCGELVDSMSYIFVINDVKLFLWFGFFWWLG